MFFPTFDVFFDAYINDKNQLRYLVLPLGWDILWNNSDRCYLIQVAFQERMSSASEGQITFVYTEDILTRVIREVVHDELQKVFKNSSLEVQRSTCDKTPERPSMNVLEEDIIVGAEVDQTEMEMMHQEMERNHHKAEIVHAGEIEERTEQYAVPMHEERRLSSLSFIDRVEEDWDCEDEDEGIASPILRMRRRRRLSICPNGMIEETDIYWMHGEGGIRGDGFSDDPENNVQQHQAYPVGVKNSEDASQGISHEEQNNRTLASQNVKTASTRTRIPRPPSLARASLSRIPQPRKKGSSRGDSVSASASVALDNSSSSSHDDARVSPFSVCSLRTMTPVPTSCPNEWNPVARSQPSRGRRMGAKRRSTSLLPTRTTRDERR